MTQETPNTQKIKDHKSWPTVRCQNKWITLFPWFLRKKHHSTTITPRFLKILSNVTHHEKKATRGGALTLQMLLQGNALPTPQ